MISNNEIIQRLVLNEGYSSSPYKCSAGKVTIGFGRCIETNPFTKEEKEYIGHCGNRPITKDQAFYLLRNDIEKVKKQIEAKMPWSQNLNPDRQYVLIDMIFQMGIEGVLKFKKTLQYLSTGLYQQAAKELLNSTYAKQTPARAMRNSKCIETGIYKC